MSIVKLIIFMKKTIQLSVIISGMGLLAACGPKKEIVKNDPPVAEKGISTECPQDIICTMDFRTVGVKVVDTNGNPVKLDRYQTVVKGTNQHLIHPDKQMPESIAGKGNYILADDNSMSIVGKNGKEIEFIGYVNGTEVIHEKYVIGHDCCHIKLISGNQEVVIK